MSISIRVRGKTVADEYRVIIVSGEGSRVTCDCSGFDGRICSHVDAVLIAQERAMVHHDDLALADLAVVAVAGRIEVPGDWRGAWRKNFGWRGLSRRGSSFRKTREGNKPLVCFTGTLNRPRAGLLKEAETYGWETIDSPSPFIDVLVAADPYGLSGKLKAARKNRTPIITLEEWSIMMTDGVLPSAATA